MKNSHIKAVVLGATGMVGSELLKQLINDARFAEVLVLTRRKLNIADKKITELIVNFDKPEDWLSQIQGDVLFSAFGTTIKKAGSQENQYKIDYSYQWQVAKAASDNRMQSYILISALGANASSSMFYNRMKGELDVAVQKLNFENVTILKPSLLDGNRKEQRVGEKLGLLVFRFIKYIPGLRTYRPIHVEIVAKAMVNAVFKLNKINSIESSKIFELAKSES